MTAIAKTLHRVFISNAVQLLPDDKNGVNYSISKNFSLQFKSLLIA